MTTAQMSPAPSLQSVKQEGESIRQAFLATGSARTVFERRSHLVEAVVLSAYSTTLAPAFPDGLALVATGGFGRQQLFPHSDVDLLILTAAHELSPASKEALSLFLQHIWDAGLRVSQSVRTVNECCELHENNVEFNISLLDQRFLAGDPSLYQQLQRLLPRFLHSQRETLARRLCRLTHQRHAKFHNTIYHLEPNIKETPGGIRDLNLFGWLHAICGSPDTDPTQLAAASEFLFSLRCFLHFASNRDNNLLSFDAQEELPHHGSLGLADPSVVMREYFRHARLIHRAALRTMEAYESKRNSLLAGFRDWRSRLSNSEFTVSRDRILLKSPHAIANDPSIVLRLFELIGRHNLSLHSETERRLQDSLAAVAAYFSSGALRWPAIESLFNLPHASVALRAMHDTGVLKLIFPDWEQIECYVVRDFHHRYTVDEHTLIAIETLERLPSATDPGHGHFAGILSEVENLAILRLALLFHDIGKSTDIASHSQASAGLAANTAERFGMPESQRLLLITLVENHLVLSAATTGRDLDDPATAFWLAHCCGTVEVLKYLTLLTYADTAAVHPTALSPWRLQQLWRVYLNTHRELTRELDSERITDTQSTVRIPEREAFLKGFPTRYLRIHTEEQIQRHLQLELQRREAGVTLEIRREAAAYHLTVLAKDRLFLFASVAGALASFGMNILKAEAFANQQGTILDTFVFTDPHRSLELNPTEMDRLHHTLERVLLGRADAKSLLKHRPRIPAPSKNSRIPGRVSFDSESSATATLVEVVAQDRPGLLYELAAAFSEAGCSIDVVLVDTEAHKALDVFYVTAGGLKLSTALQELLQNKILQVCGT